MSDQLIFWQDSAPQKVWIGAIENACPVYRTSFLSQHPVYRTGKFTTSRFHSIGRHCVAVCYIILVFDNLFVFHFWTCWSLLTMERARRNYLYPGARIWVSPDIIDDLALPITERYSYKNPPPPPPHHHHHHPLLLDSNVATFRSAEWSGGWVISSTRWTIRKKRHLSCIN